MKSLQQRLSVGLFISLFSVFMILWWLTSNSIRYLAEESVAEHLEHDAMSINKLGRDITIALAEDLSPTLKRIASFQQRYTLISLLLLLLLITIQVIILRKSFYPLVRIQKQIRALEHGERSQLDTHVPQEVAVLVAEVNWLLSVLDQRLQRSRNALSDLAHALKTPLTVLQQLPEEDLKSQPEICHTLQTQTRN